MENTSEKKYLTLIQKVGYGVGDLGSNYCWTFVASFIMIYCTNTLGVIMMLSKFLDGVSDVIMGRIIDRTKSKMGKARFWYALSAFPVAFFTFLLFNVPSGFTKNTQYVYIFIAYTLMGVVFYTMSNIAYSSLTALVTKNQKERVQLGSYRFIFAGLAVILIGTFTSDLVEYFGGGQHGWTIVSLIYSLICFVFLFIPVLAVKELSDSELMESGNETEKENKIGFIESVKLLFKNKYFIMLLVWYLVMYLASGVTSGLGIYYTTYKLNNAGLLGTLSMVGMIPAMIILLFVPQLTEKFGIRRVSIWGAVFGSLGINLGETGAMAIETLKEVVATPEVGLFMVLEEYPLGSILAIVAIISLCAFFVTSANSGVYVLSMLTTDGAINPPNSKKVLWGIIQSIMAIGLLMAGGLKPLQTISLAAAFPFIFIMFGACAAFIKSVKKEKI